MLSLNLLPDIKKEFLKAQHMKWLIMIACIAVSAIGLAVLAITGLILVGQNSAKENVRSEIKANYNKIIAKKDKTDDVEIAHINRLLTIQSDIKLVNDTYVNIPISSRVFDFLREANNLAPNNATLDRVALTTGGISNTKTTAVITGSIVSFPAFDSYKLALESARFISDQQPDKEDAPRLFNSVKDTSSSFDPQRNRVSFHIQVEFNVDAFRLTTVDKDGKTVLMTNVRAFVPNQTTSDAAKNIPVFSSSTEEEVPEEGGNDGN
jgi:hypothetical protein